MLDRRIAFEITGDTAGWSKAVADAQKLNQQAQANAATLNANLQRLDGELLQSHIAILTAQTEAEQIAAERRLTVVNTLYEETTAQAQRAAQAQIEAEAQVTAATVEGSAKQASAVKAGGVEMRAAIDGVATSAKALLLAFLPITLAIMAVRTIKDAITGYGDLGHEVKHLADIMGTTTEKASVLDYTFKQFGLSGANVTQTIAQLTRHVVDQEKEFNALGVQTRSSNGDLLSTYDIFNSLREVMSNAADGTAKTADMLKLLARSGSAGGAALGELQQILGLTDEQMAAFERQARANNAVLDKSQALMGTDMVQAGRELGQAIGGLGRTLGELAAGPLTGLINKVSTAISMFELLTSTVAQSMTAAQGIPVISGLLNLVGNADDYLSGKQTDALTSISDKMKQIEADRKALADLGGGDGTGNQVPTFPPGGGGGSDQAIKDQMDALKAALERYTQEKQAAIDAINAEKQARDEAFNDQIAQLRDVQAARRAADQEQIQRINDATAALEDQYTLRQRDREDAISGLRDQISLLDQQFAIQTAQDQLVRDQHAQATTESAGPVTMRRGEHLEDYYKRVHENELKLKDEKKKVEDDKEKIARDAQKRILEDQIKAIEAVGKADQRALQDAKKNATERIKDIEKIEKAETAKTEKAIKEAEALMKADDKQSAAKIKGIEAQIKAEKERVDDLVLQLEKALKAHQALASGMGSAYGAAFSTIKQRADEATAAVAALHAEMERNVQSPDARDRNAATLAGQLPKDGDTQVIAGTTFRYRNGTWSADTISPDAAAPSGRDVNHVGRGLDLTGLQTWLAGLLPSSLGETHAAGGSILLRDKTALVGLGSGRVSAVAGAGETVSITPRGGGSGVVRETHVHVYGLAYPDAVREVARAVQRAQDQEAAAADSFGYTRR